MKTGFIGNWQNLRWCFKPTPEQRGQTDKNIAPGGTGNMQNFFTLTARGFGEYEDDEGDLYTIERLYLSAPFISDIGNYRVGVLFKRNSYTSSAARAYTFIAEVDSAGKLSAYGSNPRATFSTVICDGSHARAWLVNLKTGYKWTDIVNNIPLMTAAGVSLTSGPYAGQLFRTFKNSWTADISTVMLTFCDKRGSSTAVTDSALTPATTTPDASTICERMAQFATGWAYWYGGNGETANQDLLDDLAAAYPGIYTADKIEHCKQDIPAGVRVADCSYAVSYAYNIARVDTWWFSQQYATWTGTPKNGMILVRRTAKNGHVAIYKDGYTMEMSSTYEDYQQKPYDATAWTRIAYDPNRSY